MKKPDPFWTSVIIPVEATAAYMKRLTLEAIEKARDEAGDRAVNVIQHVLVDPVHSSPERKSIAPGWGTV